MDSTLTPFLRGKIRVHQPLLGYRFNVDSVLLAGFTWVREGERVLDLGTGTGILLLLLAHWHLPSSLTGVEIQPELAGLAALNLEENGWSDIARVIEGDLRLPDGLGGELFDLAVCNPPYYQAGRGMASADPARATARQDATASLADVLRAGARCLRPKGRLVLLCPAPRLSECLAEAAGAGLHPRLLRRVRSGPGAPEHVLLLQFRREAGRGCVALPDLHLRDEAGRYTPEVEGWLGDRPPESPRFLCDAMVGKLARYLRLCGLDAAYARDAEDEWLAEQAGKTGRVLLTRDRPLLAACAKRSIAAFEPPGDEPAAQFAAVLQRFGLPGAGARPRCLDCNAPVLEVSREEALGKVPPYTYLTHRRFSACSCCGRITWEGSHLERFKETVMRE
ncbi:MAG: Mut7-C RNAse domain-containing protein [Acidobacteriota bacterium]